MNTIRSFALASTLTALIAGAALPAAAQAQAWPNRPIKVILPAPAGSPGDIIARAISDKLVPVLGQPIVVDNRAGANYAIGTEAVAKSPADGYTVLVTASPHTINPALYPNLTVDPIRDFAPVTLVAVTPLILVVNPGVPAKTVGELIAWLKTRPGQVNFGSAGNGSTLHLAGDMFNKMAGVNMVHVPYKGVTQAVTDLLGGHVSLMFPGGPIALPQVKSGKLRALASTGTMRTAAAPELPTVAEAGLPGFEISAWYGVLFPANTPAAIVTRMHTEIVKLMKSPDLKERWTGLGADVVYQDTPEQFATFLKNDLAKWAKVIKDGNIKPD